MRDFAAEISEGAIPYSAARPERAGGMARRLAAGLEARNIGRMARPRGRPPDMRILLVEDEHKVAQFLRKGLQQDHFAVDLAADGEEALFLADSGEYDLIILDLMLPKVSGFSVLSTVRKKNPNVPILILTAKTAVEDRVRGLEIGSDDYLIKPFAYAELRARVRALLRREWRELKLQLRVGDLMLDPVKRKVWRGDKELELSNKEFMLLEYLMRNANQVVTRTMIAEHVWDASFDSFTNVIDVYISFLRNKIDKDRDPKLIQSVRGVGYMLRDEGPEKGPEAV